jgi:transcription elongation factor Elf1
MPNNVSIHKYRNKYDVTVICPKCGDRRQETWTQKPDMKQPRVACKQCKSAFRGDDQAPDVRGISLRSHAAQKTRRAVNA